MGNFSRIACLLVICGGLSQGLSLQLLPAQEALPLILPGVSNGAREEGALLAAVQVTRGETPAWVTEISEPKLDANALAEIAEQNEAPDGVVYLLNATQVNVPELASHTSIAQKVLNVRGAQATVRLVVPFNPAFENLCFHQVTIEREGQVQDRLADMSFRLYQKEDRAAELVYRGALQAVGFIPDVRPGDVLRYSYTVRGGHPLFAGRFDEVLFLNVRGSREKRVLRVLSETAHPVRTQLRGGRFEGESRALAGGLFEQVWTQENMPVPPSEGDLPDWYWPFPVLQITQFQSWQDVAEMFAPLYASQAGTNSGPLYQAALRAIRDSHESQRERIQAALDLVRDNVRYLSLSEGEGGFKPRAPEEVLGTRLGDCKDKTRLLCSLLADLGVTAYPALVSNRERAHLKEVRASPNVFDHVVLELHWDDKVYWLDPTINQESQDFRRDYFPYFGRALVLMPGTDGLREIGSDAQATRRIRVHRKFEITGAQVPAELKVTSIYTGAAAYQERELQMASGKRNLDNLLLESNAERYEALMLGKPRSVKDDLARNQLTSVEEYVIPRLWQDPSGEGRNVAVFSSAELPALLLAQIAALPRSQPLAVEHPVHLTEEIEIHSPIVSEAQPRDYQVSAPAFEFTHQVKVEGHTLRLLYDYKSTSDFVPGDKTATQLQKLNEVLTMLAYSIRYPERFGGEPAKPASSKQEKRKGKSPRTFVPPRR